MGKDQDLLDAARCGNISVVERYLNQRAKKTGPLASLRRGPGPNIQDNSGYTPLHHAALNGHKDIVLLLLNHDASVNIVDDKGCTPLHLASWSGNVEIVKILLTHGPSAPNVNQMNFDHESALHSAAQYGHTEIAKLLLQHNCYPSVRNVRSETPLDLASQYGRLETVQCLINTHPVLLNDVARTHSPLHLASKNGHKSVVKVLLDAGFDINYMTDVGTALHEAAMYGKLEVVRLLLDYGRRKLFGMQYSETRNAISSLSLWLSVLPEIVGIDVTAENCRKRTVFDILQDISTAIAKQIEDVIKDHMTLIKLDSDSNESFPILPPQGFLSCSLDDALIPERCSLTNISPPQQFCSSSPENSVYEVPPPPKLLDHNLSGTNDSLSSLTPPQSQDSSFDLTSFSSSCSPSKCEPSHTAIYENSIYQNVDPGSLLYEIPPPPSFFSSKRFSDPLQQSSIYQNVILSDSAEKKEEESTFESHTLPTSWTLPDSYIPMQPILSVSSNNRPQVSIKAELPSAPVCPEFLWNRYSAPVTPEDLWKLQTKGQILPPAKPPRKSVNSNSCSKEAQNFVSRPERSSYEFLFLAHSGTKGASPNHVDGKALSRSKTVSHTGSSYEPESEYVDMSLGNNVTVTYENQDIVAANGLNSGSASPTVKSTKSHLLRWTYSSNKFSEILPFPSRYEKAYRKAGSFNNLMPSKSTPALHASRHTLDQVIPIGANDREFHALKPSFLNFRLKRATIQIPTSPTNYQQPPTPDIPPPSPATAETGIHEKICPINQEYKTKKQSSRDIDTLTDEHLVATIGPSGEVQLTLSTDNKCVATESDDATDNPFAGLCHGSVSHSGNNKLKCQLPVNVHLPRGASSNSRRSRNTYENVNVVMEEDQNKVVLSSSGESSGRGSNRSSLSIMSPFDEKAEWAEIADIMASFGGGIARESLFAQNMESQFAETFRADTLKHRSNFTSVEQWLSSLNLSHYENVLIINGFDDMSFLGGKILDDQDLEEIGISNAEHRMKICTAAQKLPSVQPISKLKDTPEYPSSVDEWLASLNLQEYSENFKNNNITDMDRAVKLWEVEINTVLKITKLGHRKRILASLGEKHFSNYLSSEDLDLSKLNLDLSQLDFDDGLENGHENNYGSIVKCPDNSEQFVPHAASGQNHLKIRPPTHLMSDVINRQRYPHQLVTEAQWRHHPDDLIKSCCNYLAKYLGSTLVKELKGLESTKRSIQKLKASTKDIGKIPNIILSISYSGVKFINAETQQLVCEHEIRNIHCACQDAEDLCHFAYITKEHQTHNHYCHVFSSQSMDLASEIILTLGQAFEVAYQMAVQEKSKKSERTRDPHRSSAGSSRKSYDHKKNLTVPT